MNLIRRNNYEVTVSKRELLEALKLRFPEEFLLENLAADATTTVVADDKTGTLRLFGSRMITDGAIEERRSTRLTTYGTSIEAA